MRKRGPFAFEVTTVPPENIFRYTRGMTMVGCLKHDQVVWSPEREDWACPVCGYRPPKEAESHPLVVTAIDYAAGTITVS